VVWFRITAVVLLVFATMHTVGFLTFRPPSAEGLAVWHAMNQVRFAVKGSTFTYGHFYLAFGLSITAAQVFAVWLAWTLGAMAKRGTRGVQAIAWAMFAWQAVGIVLAAILIAAVPAIFSAIAAFTTGMAAWSSRATEGVA
jgi:hypothetical protein